MWVALVFPIQAKRTFHAYACVFLSRCAEVATTDWNAASQSLGNVTTVRVLELVTLGLFGQLFPNLLVPQQAVPGQELSPRHLT